jgi:hypothetical protein
VSELDANRRLLALGAEYLLNHPGAAARLMARRFVTLWRFCPNPRFVSPTRTALYALSYAPVFLLMLPGLVWGHRRAGDRLANVILVDALVLHTTAMSVVFLAMMRYRVPLMPFLIMFAALGLTTLWRGNEGGDRICAAARSSESE